MSIGNVLNIQRFCTDDGPGIRTTVFLKGCPLRCIWCHNPESQNRKAEVMYEAKKCIGCGKCASVCPIGCHQMESNHIFARNFCIGCGKCAEVCSVKAIELYGKEMLASEVLETVQRDMAFYQATNGGVTVSGGEPLFQPQFTSELLLLCKEKGIHAALETCGYASETVFSDILLYCDFVLFDIKETDEEKHMAYTGVSLKPILRNLEILNETGIPFVIRAPIIPTLNDREEHFENLRRLRKKFENCEKIQIMPYHAFGEYKYEKLGRKYLCEEIVPPTEEIIKEWKQNILTVSSMER